MGAGRSDEMGSNYSDLDQRSDLTMTQPEGERKEAWNAEKRLLNGAQANEEVAIRDIQKNDGLKANGEVAIRDIWKNDKSRS